MENKNNTKECITSIIMDKYDTFVSLIEKHGVMNELHSNDFEPHQRYFNYPLQKAVEFGRSDMVHYLVEKGAVVFGCELGAFRFLFDKKLIENDDEAPFYADIIDYLLPYFIDYPGYSPKSVLDAIMLNALSCPRTTQFMFDMFKKRGWYPEQHAFQRAWNTDNLDVIHVFEQNGYKVDWHCMKYLCGRLIDVIKRKDDPRMLHHLFKKGGSKYLYNKDDMEQAKQLAGSRKDLLRTYKALDEVQKRANLVEITHGHLKSLDFLVS